MPISQSLRLVRSLACSFGLYGGGVCHLIAVSIGAEQPRSRQQWRGDRIGAVVESQEQPAHLEPCCTRERARE